MRVRMVAGLSGPVINLMPGDEADFSNAEAAAVVAAGFAVPVAGVKIERAVKPSRKVEKR